jgi:type IX secretion system PorP/SprF family membrane protein
MKIPLTVALVVLIALSVRGQQDPLYAQYFNNPMLINPAFAGSNERLYAGIAYRKQWTGLDGAPTTFNFNSHIALANNKVGAGIIVIKDKVGEFASTQYGGTVSYRIKLNKAIFSFGMQLGFTQYSTNLENVRVQYADPLFAPFTQIKFNTGAGVLLKNDRYAVGISVPQLIANKISQGGQAIQVYNQHYYLYGNYVFFLSERIEFKPSALLRFTRGSALTTDLNLNLTFNRLYTVGVFTRNLNTHGVLLQAVMGNARMGYIFELPGKSSTLNYVTHEISLSFSLAVLAAHEHTITGL